MSTVAVRTVDRSPVPTAPALRGPRRRSPWVAVVALAVVSASAWLPFLSAPLSSDEGGFLMVAAQWAPGTSLYGDYWVDRPPLLIGLFQLADLGGGAIALRLLGIAAVLVSVLLAADLGRRLAPRTRSAPVLTAATAAVFLATPLFGTTEVDGELLAVPFVLAGLGAILRAATASSARREVAWWVAAGILATAAGAVKQSMLEVFVAAAATTGWLLWTRRPGRAARAVAGFGFGSVAALVVLLCWAASRGTDPAALWDAVVSFRAEASAVISSSATSSTPLRGLGLAAAFLASGAGALLLVAVLPGRRGIGVPTEPAPYDARVLAAAVTGWEAVAVVGGGSYWLHYLLGTVPGLVLMVAAAARHRPGRLRVVRAVLAWSGLVGLVAVAAVVLATPGRDSDTTVERYLSAHSAPGDTGVVAFGDPAILQAAGLGSPYPELWSLPVRVRDPQLAAFTRVLTGTDRPTWVVVSGGSLATWGVDASTAQPVLDREYRPVDTAGDWHVYRLRSGAEGRSR